MQTTQGPEYWKVIGPFLGALFIAVISAIATVKLALRRFYSEKQWERRADAYTRIFVALHHVKNHALHELSQVNFEDRLGIEPSLQSIAEERQKVLDGLKVEMQNGIGELHLQIDIGTFAISESAVQRLEKLMDELDAGVSIGKQKTYRDYLDHRISTLEKCLVDLRKIADEDLSKGFKFKSTK